MTKEDEFEKLTEKEIQEIKSGESGMVVASRSDKRCPKCNNFMFRKTYVHEDNRRHKTFACHPCKHEEERV